MPFENNQAGSVDEWIRHAKSDLELAKTDPPSTVLLEALCFHAQQSAEKALKALLISRGLKFQRTHNIGTLLDILEEHISIPEDIWEATILTDYAVTTRYPGAPEPVDESEFNEAIRIAEAVLSWTQGIIR